MLRWKLSVSSSDEGGRCVSRAAWRTERTQSVPLDRLTADMRTRGECPSVPPGWRATDRDRQRQRERFLYSLISCSDAELTIEICCFPVKMSLSHKTFQYSSKHLQSPLELISLTKTTTPSMHVAVWGHITLCFTIMPHSCLNTNQ